MKKIKLITLIILITFIISCSNDNSPTSNFPELPPVPALEYVQGIVLVGLKDSTTLTDFANYVYSLDDSISIRSVWSLNYASSVSRDSLQIIQTVLESKPYIDKNNMKITYVDSASQIQINLWVKNFLSNEREDWEAIKKRFSLIHLPYDDQNGELRVGIGREKEWKDIFSSNKSLFRYAELDYICYLH